ncbi:SHD1 domain-containing protein [Cerasicoccus maritimus]|uniref:SHD1 domain-containing protein n=1 Tax=Cerasicoccus maritimus TaxID=490089 RepID=UPI00285255BC|nr:SHD1 domain-containing protein [Cerasicoccus maritimus]
MLTELSSQRFYIWMRWLGYVALCCLVPWLARGEPRTWTDKAGRQVEAEFIALEAGHVKIKRSSDGRTYLFPVESLSREDQAYLRKIISESGKTEAVQEAKPFEGLQWPRKVGLPDNYDVQVVKEDNATNVYIYRTPNFEFHSDVKLARKVVRDFGKIFESTYAAMQVFPLKWKPHPSEARYVTRLFKHKQDYYDAGGLPNSGGVYFSSKREIWTPLASLGVKKSSSSYTLDDSDDHGTLIHEITHQVHHDWLGKLPPWIIEGMAVYMESVPYRKGEFRFDKRKVDEFDRLQRRGLFRMVSPEELMTMSASEWNSNFANAPDELRNYYLSAFLLFNYFLHLDGEGEGRRIYAYVRAIESGASDQDARQLLLAGRSYQGLTEQIKDAYKREDIDL